MFKFILILKLLKVSWAELCSERYFLEDQLILPENSDTILIEREDNFDAPLQNYELNNDFIKYVSTLEFQDEGKVIQIIHRKSEYSDFETQFCQLIVDTAKLYKIRCKDGYKNYLIDNQYDFTFKTEYLIVFSTEQEELCEQIFFYEQHNFLIFCYGSTYFKLLKVDYKNQTEEIIKYDHNNINQRECKTFASHNSNQSYIAFFGCSDWILYHISNDNTVNSFDKQYLGEVEELINIYDCIEQSIHSELFLQFKNYYYVFRILNREIIKIENHKILFPVFSKYCTIKFSLLQNEQTINDFFIYEKNIEEQFSQQNFSTTEIPQQGLLVQNRLMLIYPTFVTVFYSYSLKLDYNIKLGFLKTLSEDKLFYSLDYETKNVHVYSVHLNSSKKFISSQIKSQNFLEFFLPTFWSKKNIFYINCFKPIKVTDSVNRWISFLTKNFTAILFESETEVLYFFSKNWFQANEPYKLNFSIGETLLQNTDFYDLKNICQLKNLESIFIINIFYLNGNWLLIALDKDELIFIYCQINKIIKFKNIILLKEKQVLKQSDKLIAISENSNNLFVFNILAGVNLIKNYTFSESINNIFLEGNNFIYITLDSHKTYSLKLENLEIELLFQHYPLQQPFIFYLFKSPFRIIQNQEKIFIELYSTQILISLSNATLISYQSLLKTICLNVVQQKNKIITYCVLDDKLIQKSEFSLLDYILTTPPKSQFSQENLIVAAQKGSELFLLVFDCQEQVIFAFKEVIQVSKFVFFLVKGTLIYYDINDNLIAKQLLETIISIEKSMLCNKLETIKNIELQIVSAIDPQKQGIKQQIQLLTIMNCYELRLKYPITQFYLDYNNFKTIRLNQRDILQGSIDNIEIKLNNDSHKIKLKGPFILEQDFPICVYYGHQIFIRSRTSEQITIINQENQIDIKNGNLNSVNEEILFFKQYQSQYVIGFFNVHEIILNFYSLNEKEYTLYQQFIFPQIYESNEYNTLNKAHISGDICLIYKEKQTYLLIISQNPVLKKLVGVPIHQQILGNLDQYIFIYHTYTTDFQLKIEIYQLNTKGLALIKNVSINQLQYMEERLKFVPYLIYNQIKEIKIISCKFEEERYILKIFLLSEFHFSFLSIVEINSSDLTIFSIKKIIRLNKEINEASVMYVDQNFAILKPLNTEGLLLYDLRTTDFIIDYIQFFSFQFQIYPYNASHFVIVRNESAFIGELKFEINLEEVEFKKEPFIVQLQAKNNYSVLDFNLTVIVQSFEVNESFSYSLTIIILIILLIIVFMVRRWFLLRCRKGK